MLVEVKNVSQVEGESQRRWFTDEFFDLIVWEEEDSTINAFQLCYDKPRKEHALTWRRNQGYRHDIVDDGENIPGGPKQTPILVKDGASDLESVPGRFKKNSLEIDKTVSTFVYRKIADYAGGRNLLETISNPE